MWCAVTIPIILEPLPPAILGLTSQEEAVYDHIVVSVSRRLAGANVPAHGHIQQHRQISHGPRALRDLLLHDGPPVDVPDHPALPGLAVGLVPDEVVADGPAVQVGDLSSQDAVLLWLMMIPPVVAGPVLVVPVPRLGDVDLAVDGPREGLLGQQPEGGPDAFGARRENHRRQDAPVSGERLSAHESGRRVSLLGAGCGIISYGSKHELAVWSATRVFFCQPQ